MAEIVADRILQRKTIMGRHIIDPFNIRRIAAAGLHKGMQLIFITLHIGTDTALKMVVCRSHMSEYRLILPVNLLIRIGKDQSRRGQCRMFSKL